MSVPEAAERLAVSEGRVRQRIQDGSLVAEKIGGRWIVDLDASPGEQRRGRPPKPDVVWMALLAADHLASLDACTSAAVQKLPGSSSRSILDGQHRLYGMEAAYKSCKPDFVFPDGSVVELKLSASSWRRALNRLNEASCRVSDPSRDISSRDDALWNLMGWLHGRAERRMYRAAERDVEALRRDDRFLVSGLSHPESQMEDVRVAEGYAAQSDVDGLAEDYWLDPVGVGEKPNVFLHLAPFKPESVSPLMLAADLAEHGGPREAHRALDLAAHALECIPA